MTFIFSFNNECEELDLGVLYFVNFETYNIVDKENKTLYQIFIVSGVIPGWLKTIVFLNLLPNIWHLIIFSSNPVGCLLAN